MDDCKLFIGFNRKYATPTVGDLLLNSSVHGKDWRQPRMDFGPSTATMGKVCK